MNACSAKAIIVTMVLAISVSSQLPVLAQAQNYPQQPNYQQTGSNRQQQGPQYSSQVSNEPYAHQPYDAPPGYDGSQPPPPPPGYVPDQNDQHYQNQDRRYAQNAQDWAGRYCVRSERRNSAVGAFAGGILGAVIGSRLSGRHDHGDGALIGGFVGGVSGAAIASSPNRTTSPGCPPGYVMRRGAPGLEYDNDYQYAAPGWYLPWYFLGGRWLYRPYPYRAFYYNHYHQSSPYRYYGNRRRGW